MAEILAPRKHSLSTPVARLPRTSHVTTPSQLKVLDLFAGAGGFSEGFIANGCDMIAHVEMDKDACSTIRTRMVYHALRRSGNVAEYKKYLLGKVSMAELVEKYELEREVSSVIQAKIDRTNYAELIKEVQQRLGGSKLDIIIGGPPCQAYSHIGRASDKRHMKGDQRKFLYEYYVEFLKALRPNVFVFENVPGLLSAGKGSYLREMRKLMKEIGYQTDFNILNTSDFGVPQYRKRVILIGWTKDSGLDAYPEFTTVSRKYRVSDFLDGLPKLRHGEGQDALEYKEESKLLKQLGIADPSTPVLLGHVARPHTKRDLEIYRIAVRTKRGGKNIKYNELPERLKTHKNRTGFSDRFKVIDSVAESSHTVIAHISKDGHYYIHPDIEQNRSLSAREAARIQTFPDNFKFEGSRTSQFRQIGNAVPPMFSKIIAETILRQITNHGKKRI
jgi:DNA (cytosine-5)-methyltransferase 1